ncbi:ABC transporter permease [Actinospica sp.]|uniref:ABC transporter permease n=1 Tax=Actinospica sp. TaxID=1872142 RepID=UPI002CF6D8E2|nr:ABC-2 family transporter protein [Actinospica sp.]HWG27378.1 ABC-2 family transporter protein [Actinospica sp.]
MRVYLTAVRLSLRRYLAYRSSAVAGAFTNTVFGCIRAFVLIALWKQKPEIAGWDLADAVTYAFLTQGLITPMGIFMNNTDLGPRIRTGDIAVDLYRPVDFQTWWLSLDLGRALGAGMLRTLPPVLFGVLLFPVRLPLSPLRWAEFAVCCFLGYLISFGLRYLASLATFWTMDERGMSSILVALGMFCSGLIIPLTIIPGAVGTVLLHTPWAAAMQMPINVLLGTQSGGFGYALAFGSLWALLLLGAGRLLTDVARHKVVVQGG